MEDNQPGSVATGSGGLGTDDTTSIEVVEPSLLQPRVTACLSISTVLTVLHVLEIPGQPQKVLMLL